MHSNMMFAALSVLGMVAATPLDYSMHSRATPFDPTKKTDKKCAGEIIGYHTVPNAV